MYRSARSSEREIAGFTLIEGLVALAVAATGITAIGSLSFSGLRSSIEVERHIALIATAREIVAGLPDRDELADGDLSGVVDSHSWRIDAGPFSASAAPASGSIWEPQLIALSVRAPGGGIIEIDTVRLRRRAPQ